MLGRSRLALLACAASLSVALGGCAEDGADDNIQIGDGDSPTDELVAERQLNGSELAAKTLSLTFDDGPGRRTSELADYLAANGVKATFFINGVKVPGRQGAIDSIIGRGHLLGNHTQNHKQLTSLPPATLIKEIADTDAILADAQPGGPWVLRAPYGAWNGKVARAVNATPLKKYVGSVFWDEGGTLTSTSAADWDCWGKHVSVEHCADLYLNEIRTRKHGIVLMHDIHDKTVDMIKVVLPKLIAEGYSFAPLVEVPSVKRAIASAGAPVNDNQCQSATLGRAVDENVCVQSKSTQKWSRCVDGEWTGSTGPADTKCIDRFPLSP